MKKVAGLIFAGLLTFSMLSGCATKGDVERLQATQNQILQRLGALEQSQADMAQAAQDAAQRAEAAADRAEAMAAKSESVFMKHMKK